MSKGKYDSPMTTAYKAPNPGSHLGLPMESEPTGKIDQHNVCHVEKVKKTPADSPMKNTFKLRK